MLGRKAAAMLERPGEFRARIRNKTGALLDSFSPRPEFADILEPPELEEAIDRLVPAQPIEGQANRIQAIEYAVNARTQGRRAFANNHDGTRTLGRLCYLLCRRLRPRTVIETGVAHGVTSAYILAALEDNNAGELVSIDLPPLVPDANRFVGSLVPEDLRGRWHLRIGSANDLLPDSLRAASGSLDLFIHDSLHTYKHMRWEFRSVLPALAVGGVIVSDDVEGNRAFLELLEQPEIRGGFVIRQEAKASLCGAAVKVGRGDSYKPPPA